MNSGTFRTGLGVYLVLLLNGFSVTASASFSNLVVFGDSLSDTGNVYTQTGGFIPQAPYDNGRFSNGPVYVEVLAQHLSLDVTNTLSGGDNYAWGGATIVPGSSTPSLEQQYSTYMSDVSGVADPNALYVVYGGGNDLFGSSTVAEAEQAANSLLAIIANLVGAGAQNVLVPNLPDLGATPNLLGSADATNRSMHFNATLASGLGGVSGASIHLLDVFSILNDIVADGAGLGFSNVTEACYTGTLSGGGATCSNPDSYVFWDDIHPTAAAHKILGDRAFAAVVPVPAAGWLLASALLVLVNARRR